MFDNSLEKRHFVVHSIRAYLEHEYPINLIICYTFSNDYTNHLIFISSDTVISLIYFEKILILDPTNGELWSQWKSKLHVNKIRQHPIYVLKCIHTKKKLWWTWFFLQFVCISKKLKWARYNKIIMQNKDILRYRHHYIYCYYYCLKSICISVDVAFTQSVSHNWSFVFSDRACTNGFFSGSSCGWS